jgi:hypothetical protein
MSRRLDPVLARPRTLPDLMWGNFLDSMISLF